jgi:hypothetical protein
MKTKKYSNQLKTRVKQNLQFTLNKDLALDLGKEQGVAPITFIHPKHRETFLRAWPELGLPPVDING